MLHSAAQYLVRTPSNNLCRINRASYIYQGVTLSCLQSTCFFLGPAISRLEALQTILFVVEPTSSYLNAVALSLTTADILSADKSRGGDSKYYGVYCNTSV